MDSSDQHGLSTRDDFVSIGRCNGVEI